MRAPASCASAVAAWPAPTLVTSLSTSVWSGVRSCTSGLRGERNVDDHAVLRDHGVGKDLARFGEECRRVARIPRREVRQGKMLHAGHLRDLRCLTGGRVLRLAGAL